MSSKQIAGKPERYYVKNGVLFANSDYEPQRVVADSTNDLIAVQDKLEPGAIGHVTGTDVNFELGINNTWVGQSGIPMVKPEDPDIITDQVIFIDYDGSVVVSYTKDLFMEMTEMPPNPKHDGLISQGWNWELDRIKYYLEKYPDCVMTVGQMYCTADDATHIHLNVQGRLTVPLMFQQDVSEGVTIDWGDGTKETVEGTDVVTTEHIYAAEGEYVLKMKAANGCEMNFGGTVDEVDRTIFGENVVNSAAGISNKFGRYITKIFIASNITNINKYAFYGCYSLTALTIPEGVTSIEQYAFSNCLALAALTIPEGVTSIEQYAFYGCYTLFSLTIPEGITNIRNSTFSNCLALTSLVIPEGVTSIEQHAFTSCLALASLIIPEGVTSIGIYAFTSCFSLKSLVISEGVISIGEHAFYSCYALTSLTIPESVTTIGQFAFMGCNVLTSLVISEGVTTIGQYAFTSCFILSALTIPESVTTIGQYTFASCYFLKMLTLMPVVPPALNNANGFLHIPNDCIIYVPYSEDHSILTAYQEATNWSTFASQMVESEPEEEEATNNG